MRRKIVCLLLVPLVFISCKEQCSTNVCLISQNFWTHERIQKMTDSVLCISIYTETNRYINYSTRVKKVPVQVDPALKKQYELVDEKTIYWNKGDKISDDYNRLLKKGIIHISPSNIIDDSHNGTMYVLRKSDRALKNISSLDFFLALENNETLRLAQSKLEEDKGFDEVSESLFNQHP